MSWRKRNLWKAGSMLTGISLLLVLTIWVFVSTVSAQQVMLSPRTQRAMAVQATPTVDTTMAALQKEQLTQQIAGQQHTWDNWIWSNAAAILSSFLSTLVIVIGALVGCGVIGEIDEMPRTKS